MAKAHDPSFGKGFWAERPGGGKGFDGKACDRNGFDGKGFDGEGTDGNGCATRALEELLSVNDVALAMAEREAGAGTGAEQKQGEVREGDDDDDEGEEGEDREKGDGGGDSHCQATTLGEDDAGCASTAGECVVCMAEAATHAWDCCGHQEVCKTCALKHFRLEDPCPVCCQRDSSRQPHAQSRPPSPVRAAVWRLLLEPQPPSPAGVCSRGRKSRSDSSRSRSRRRTRSRSRRVARCEGGGFAASTDAARGWYVQEEEESEAERETDPGLRSAKTGRENEDEGGEDDEWGQSSGEGDAHSQAATLSEDHASCDSTGGEERENGGGQGDSHSQVAAVGEAEADEPSTAGECVVCMAATATHVITPCGHQALCETCAPRFPAGERCPTCRQGIEGIYKIYVPAPREQPPAPSAAEPARFVLCGFALRALVEMGFKENASRLALRNANGEVDTAVAMMVSMETSVGTENSETWCARKL